MYLQLYDFLPCTNLLLETFETNINSNFRCFDGYPNCDEYTNRIPCVTNKSWNMFHDGFPESEQTNPFPITFI